MNSRREWPRSNGITLRRGERGDFDIAGVIAGEACALIHDIPPAKDIVERIVREAEPLLERLNRLSAAKLGSLAQDPR